VLEIPALSAIVLLIVYAIEIVSCFNNYFEARGLDIRISFTSIFRHWFKKVSKSDVDIVEKKEE
jgi:hypothetical protein